MKKCIVLLCLFLFISCSVSKEEMLEFKDYYYFRMHAIVEYEKMVEKGEDIHLNDWMVFLENCSYLENLTGYHFSYIKTEPPYYEDTNQLKQDTAYLTKWFEKNKGRWSMRKADKYVYKKRKGHTVFF